MNVEEAARQLAEELVVGEGVHQVSTLNPAKVRVLAAIHHLDRPCTDGDLTVFLGWTRQYVYRMVNELAEQGVLIRNPGLSGPGPGRPATLYRCTCSLNPEGT